MTTITFKEQYFDVWMLAWNFHKKYAEKPDRGETFWEQATNESVEILEKYSGKQQQLLLRALLAATLAELQRQGE